jgi:hypothetical protein
MEQKYTLINHDLPEKTYIPTTFTDIYTALGHLNYLRENSFINKFSLVSDQNRVILADWSKLIGCSGVLDFGEYGGQEIYK